MRTKGGFTENWYTVISTNSVGQSRLKGEVWGIDSTSLVRETAETQDTGYGFKEGPQVLPYKREVGKGEDIGQDTKASISLGITFIASMEWERSSLFVRPSFKTKVKKISPFIPS